MNKSLIAIFSTVFLDAVAVGIVFPVLPTLLKDVTHTDNIAVYVGIISAVYALMQFIFSPLLGTLSDRIGRRTVLLLSLSGAVASYFFMTIAATLPLLIAGRVIAGITGASMPVALACLTDISAPEKRARNFGLFNAMFGMGFIFGPVLGGFLGEFHLRLPLLFTALLNACNFILVLLFLPETHQTSWDERGQKKSSGRLSLRQFLAGDSILPVVATFFILSFGGEACGICWAMWGYDAFKWDGFHVGLSLGVLGFFLTLTQIFLPGPSARRLGERGAALAGIIARSLALCVMGMATKSWMIFAVMPVFALGGIGTPVLQVIATRLVSSENQGQLQGMLSSVLSISSVIAPLFFSVLYSAVRGNWPGGVWLAAATINLIAIPLILYGLRNTSQHRLEQR
ncbi:TCR/Tet family MFS transporter [Acinetobacter baumannii]|nr:TCR/Tet family MFS transporter [Acinetobacter baumannii]